MIILGDKTELEALLVDVCGNIIPKQQKAFTKEVLDKRAGSQLAQKELKKAKFKTVLQNEKNILSGISIFENRPELPSTASNFPIANCTSDTEPESDSIDDKDKRQSRQENLQLKNYENDTEMLENGGENTIPKMLKKSGEKAIPKMLDNEENENHAYIFFIPDGNFFSFFALRFLFSQIKY